MGITGYVLKRLISLAITLLGVSVIVFLLVHLSPGDPIRIMLGEQARPEDVQRLTELYGFDEPLPVQYVRWMAAAVQGDLGDSIRSGTPVIELVAQRLPATLELAVVALILAVAIGIPLSRRTSAGSPPSGGGRASSRRSAWASPSSAGARWATRRGTSCCRPSRSGPASWRSSPA
jgi:ABC-type microcin C transport system permease subunit YejB